MFATANNFHARLMLGQSEALNELPDFLRKHPREILPCMIVVLDAANKQNFSVDSFIKEFTLNLQDYMTIEGNTYTLQASRNRYILFLQKLSIYHYNRGRHEEALQAAIQSWELSKTTNNHSHLRMLASLAVMYNTAPIE